MSIWKTPGQKPDPTKEILVEYMSAKGTPYYKVECGGINNMFHPKRWAYLADLIAQANKAERLQAKVDELEHIKNGWAKFAEQKDEQIQRLQKAVDLALVWLEKVATPAKCDDDLCREFTKRTIDEIKQLIKGETNVE